MKLQEIIETLSLKAAAREAGLDFRMAYATVEHVDVALFAPLQSRTIAIYPSPPPKKNDISWLIISVERTFLQKLLTKEPFCCIFAAGNKKEE